MEIVGLMKRNPTYATTPGPLPLVPRHSLTSVVNDSVSGYSDLTVFPLG